MINPCVIGFLRVTVTVVYFPDYFHSLMRVKCIIVHVYNGVRSAMGHTM